MSPFKTFLASGCSAILFVAPIAPACAEGVRPMHQDSGAPISDGTTSAPIKIEVEAGAASKKASVKVNLLWLDDKQVSREGPALLNSRALNLTVSTPWDGESPAEPANLDGLTSGTSVKLEYVVLSSKRATTPTPVALEIIAKAVALCRTKADKGYAEAKPGLGDSTSPAYPAALAALDKQHAEQLQACLDADPDDVVEAHLPGRMREYDAQLFPGDASAFGLHASLGFKMFDFIDPATLAAGSDKKTGWNVGASFTNYFRLTPTAVTFSLDYEVAYKEQDAAIFCPANVGPAPVRCVEDNAGPPQMNKSAKISVNVRHRFLNAEGNGRFAISPKVTYNISDDVWGLELPAYFIPGKDESLTGGFKIGYRSDKKDVTFGLFIGAAFGLWE